MLLQLAKGGCECPKGLEKCEGGAFLFLPPPPPKILAVLVVILIPLTIHNRPTEWYRQLLQYDLLRPYFRRNLLWLWRGGKSESILRWGMFIFIICWHHSIILNLSQTTLNHSLPKEVAPVHRDRRSVVPVGYSSWIETLVAHNHRTSNGWLCFLPRW